MKRLLLVRHGESTWNSSRRLQGQADMPLSESGESQARALAPLVARLAPSLALSSTLQRAVQTAALLGYAAATPEPALREISVGDWTGQYIDALDPVAYHNWRAGTHTPAEGEPWEAFRARVCNVVTKAQTLRADTVLMICHGGVIRAILDGLIGLAPRRLLPVAPASLTILAFRNGQPKLEALNVTPGALSLDAPD